MDKVHRKGVCSRLADLEHVRIRGYRRVFGIKVCHVYYQVLVVQTDIVEDVARLDGYGRRPIHVVINGVVQGRTGEPDYSFDGHVGCNWLPLNFQRGESVEHISLRNRDLRRVYGGVVSYA